MERSVKTPEGGNQIRNTRAQGHTLAEIFRMDCEERNAFTHNQSTHTARVRASVNQSIKILHDKYSLTAQTEGVEKILTEISEYIKGILSADEKTKESSSSEKLPKLNAQLQAAQRCLTRLKGLGMKYKTDVTADISVVYLIALTWIAIKDETCREGSLEDAKLTLVINSLYAI